MLPTVSKGRTPSSNVRPNNPVFPQYLRRIVKWQQMDIEYTFWQMLHLCTSPKVVPTAFWVRNCENVFLKIDLNGPNAVAKGMIGVSYSFVLYLLHVELNTGNSYQHTKYHKQTKNQWARDDPAFIVICSLLLVVATLAYCAAYDHSFGHAVFTVISVLFFHFLVTGVALASCCWFLTNSYLREEASNSHVVEQRVEWLYAFDVHCNSFFPMFVLLYVIHYFLSPLLVAHGFIPVLLSNLLFMVAASYYHYLNFLGYDVLPFLEKTTFFLYPIGLVIILTPLLILSGFNPTRYFMSVYFS